MAVTGASLVYTNLVGAPINLQGDGWRIRAQASRVYNLATILPKVGYGTGSFSAHEMIFSTGYRFDKYNIVSWGEFGVTSASEGTQATSGQYSKNTTAGDVLLGYRLGQFMPRYTFGSSNTAVGIIHQSVNLLSKLVWNP